MTDSFRFGRFELCSSSRQLLVDGRPATLGARAFDVLSALVERRERLVTKEELLDAAWSGLVVEENNLQVQISVLRKLLGPRAIVTIPGRGYQFAFNATSPQAVVSGMRHRHNLPAQSTSLIGRDHDVAQVRKALDIARLLTVTGAGGIGKTRLLLQVATEAIDDFHDGAWMVELAPLSDGRLVPRAVASVLSIKERGTSLTATLISELANRKMLLLMDNCEHLVDASAQLCQAVLASCPGIHILATSREALRVAGEAIYRLPSLATPDATADASAEVVARYPAVQLFAERVLTVKPSFEISESNAAAIASICRHLDGIPLAIELAAARMRSMSVDEVNARLGHRLRLLTGGVRTALPRHQTLRALIDWSYDLLRVTEQALLCRLAVFAGGWTLDAAEHVCAGAGVDGDAVLDLLASLVDKSLVVVEERDGATRYGVLETVREYASEHLRQRGEEASARQRHLAYFLAFAEEAEPQLYGGEQQAWLKRLEIEHDNLRNALARCRERDGDGVAGLRLAGALATFWWMRGYMVEGRRWLGELLAITSSPPARDAVRVKAFRWAAGIALGEGDYAAARPLHEEGLEIARALGDREGVASALIGMGQWIWAQRQADCDAAKAMFEESLAISRDLGDQRGIAMALNGLANVAAIPQREYTTARAWYSEALAIFRVLGDRHGSGYALTGLGNVLLSQGECAAAREVYEESLALARELGDQRGIAESLDGLAGAAFGLSGTSRAAHIWGSAKRLREDVHCPMATAMLPDYEQRVAAARAALGDGVAFEHAWQEGYAMTLEQALKYALDV